MGATQGRCTCPGVHKHTARSHRNDCWVFINGTPTVTCLHASCTADVADANDKIRSAWSLFQPPLDEIAMAEAREKARKRHDMEAKAAASLPEILKQYKWDLLDIEVSSKFRGAYSGKSTEIFLEKMFRPDEVVWIGEPDFSGQPHHECFFMPMQQWLRSNQFSHYTTASTFKPGTYSRSNANVLTTPYLIVEGDKVLGEPKTDDDKRKNKDACGAIFQWLRVRCGLRLRAVIDSGNKSLHGWFDYPDSAKLDELKIILPAMGCDRAMFKPSQPARLPGVIRDNGNEQKLLWIS